MCGAQFCDLAVFGRRLPPRFQIGHNDPLIGHDDHRHIGRHDRGGKSSQMQKRRAARENLVIAPRHRHQHRKEQKHQERGALTERRFAQDIVDHPANRKRTRRNGDRLPSVQIHLRRINQIKL